MNHNDRPIKNFHKLMRQNLNAKEQEQKKAKNNESIIISSSINLHLLIKIFVYLHFRMFITYSIPKTIRGICLSNRNYYLNVKNDEKDVLLLLKTLLILFY